MRRHISFLLETSGSGPSFAVSIRRRKIHCELIVNETELTIPGTVAEDFMLGQETQMVQHIIEKDSFAKPVGYSRGLFAEIVLMEPACFQKHILQAVYAAIQSDDVVCANSGRAGVIDQEGILNLSGSRVNSDEYNAYDQN